MLMCERTVVVSLLLFIYFIMYFAFGVINTTKICSITLYNEAELCDMFYGLLKKLLKLFDLIKILT